jgi:asparagine synthase (glutamine-hydrolysing)
MCGLVGLLCKNGAAADEAIVRAMRDAVAHRGPDDSGVYLQGVLGLGHCRLSIIDLSKAAAQPMVSPDGGIAVVYNGEIYNFRELRRDLEKAGWAFRSSSDTEVLIAGYAKWGIHELCRRLDGMVAFALWDRAAARLFLARDRYGVKPLYLWRAPQGLAFASEIKAFMAHPDFIVRVNQAALHEYFTFQMFRSEPTCLAAWIRAPLLRSLSPTSGACKPLRPALR